MKLLFAEDEVSMAEAVTDILTYHNYTVDTVYDGADEMCIRDSRFGYGRHYRRRGAVLRQKYRKNG